MYKKIIKYVLSIFLIVVIYISLSISQIHFFNYSNFDLSNVDFKIIAHRGAADIAPGNTLISIKKALEVSPDRIEIDIQQTKDEKLILMHDISLDRTTNGSGLVKDKTFLEISNLDAGSWFSKEFIGEKIATLEEVIELIDGKCELTIEIKKGNEYYPNIVKNLVNLIEKHNAEDWCIIHSFNTKALKDVNEINPKIKLHKLLIGKIAYAPLFIGDGIEFYNIKNYPYISEYSINYNFANKRLINYLHKNGKKINVWTVNDSIDLIDLIEFIALGVDGIITDNPSINKK